MFALAFAATLIVTPTASNAETMLASLPPRVLAFEPEPEGSRTLNKGDILWNVPLRWPSAAIIEQAIQLAADGRRTNLSVGDVLAETRLRFDDPALANAVSFCVARLADPGKATLGLIGGMLGRSLTDGQFCIVDKNRDGAADMSVLINAGSPAARMPVGIAPIRYRTDVGVEVGKGDYARLVYRGSRRFELEFYQQGSKRRYDSLTTTGNFGRESFSSWIHRAKLNDGTQVYTTPGGPLYLRQYDKAAGTITIEWKPRTLLKLMPIPDEVQTTVRFY